MASAKMTMLLDLSNKLFKSKIAQTNKVFNTTIGKMQSRFSGFVQKMHTSFSKKIDKMRIKFRGVADEIPYLNRAFDLIKNPYVAATAGLLAFGVMAKKGEQASEKFNTAFLPIKQLNLDKSSNELSAYKNQVRDAAFDIGANIKDSTNAMYDLQSATGLYGDDAIAIFKKVGKYSFATGANINDAMNSTSKAMKAFGMGVEDIDKMLESNAKTVQVGITTFDELARVQTEYAGAASSAGQDIDAANKVFAMFTSVAKNSDVGATMTKGFFDGLTQQAKKIKDELKIDVFDEKNQMRKADDILKEIAGKFKTMNDKEISNAINKIGGNEGLRGALQKVSKGADDMIKTFEAFDKSEFSLAAAIKNAGGDYTKMKQVFFNRLEIVMTKLGEKIIPALAKAFDKLTPILDFVFNNFNDILTVMKVMIPTITGLLIVKKLIDGFRAAALVTEGLTIKQWLLNSAMLANPIGLIVAGIAALIAIITIAIVKYEKFGATILMLLGPLGWLINAFLLIKKHWDSIVEAFKSDGILAGFKRIGTVLLDMIMKPLQDILGWAGKLKDWDWAKNAKKSVEELRRSLELIPDKKIKIQGEPSTLDKTRGLFENVSLNPTAGTLQFGKNITDFAYKQNKNAANDTIAGEDKTNNDNTTNNINTQRFGDNVSKVAGDAAKQRNITVNIDSFNKGAVSVKGNSEKGMTLEEVESWFNEALLRVIRSMELS